MTKLSPYIYAWARESREFKISTLEDVVRVHPHLKSVTLAFLTSDRFDEIRSWKEECVETDLDVVLSIGGALGVFPTPGKPIEDEVRDVLRLLGDMKINSIDLDIEGEAIENVEKRKAWIEFAHGVQCGYKEKFGEDLSISLTLPIEFNDGFNVETRKLILEMHRAGVGIQYYNCMVMCFNTKLPRGCTWGMKCCEIMQRGFNFLHSILNWESNERIWGRLGVCPMIGKNDDGSTIIGLEDWRFILEFAREMGIGWVSFWAINRDQRKPKLKMGSCYQYSLAQVEDYQYVELMLEVFKL